MGVENSIPDFRDGNWRPVFPGIPGIGNSRSWLNVKCENVENVLKVDYDKNVDSVKKVENVKNVEIVVNF